MLIFMQEERIVKSRMPIIPFVKTIIVSCVKVSPNLAAHQNRKIATYQER